MGVVMEDCKTEPDMLTKIYESVMSFEDRLSSIEKEVKKLGGDITLLVKAYRSHQQRLGILEDEGSPIPTMLAEVKGG